MTAKKISISARRRKTVKKKHGPATMVNELRFSGGFLGRVSRNCGHWTFQGGGSYRKLRQHRRGGALLPGIWGGNKPLT